MAEGPAAGKARRGLQKQLTTIFDGVWVPKPRAATKSAGVDVRSIEST